MTPERVSGDVVNLRPWELSDTDALVKACNDPEIARFLPLLPHPYTQDAAQEWITVGAVEAWASGGAAFAITDPVSGEVVGGYGLGNVQSGRAQGEVGYWVAPWARRRGIATAATKAAADWAFRNGFKRLELLSAKENGASQRVALNSGFTREGVRREAGPLREGTRQDLIAFIRMSGDDPGPVRRTLPDLPGGSLTDGVIRLRPLGPADTDDYLALMTIPDIARNYIGEPWTHEMARQRCHHSESNWLAGEAADCVIEDVASGAYAGDISLHYRQRFSGQAMIGYSLHPRFRGRGYMTRAVNLICDWAFAQVGVVRVIAGTFPENDASRAVLRKAGFEREGYLKAALPGRDGTRIDDIQFVRISPLVHPS